MGCEPKTERYAPCMNIYVYICLLHCYQQNWHLPLAISKLCITFNSTRRERACTMHIFPFRSFTIYGSYAINSMTFSISQKCNSFDEITFQNAEQMTCTDHQKKATSITTHSKFESEFDGHCNGYHEQTWSSFCILQLKNEIDEAVVKCSLSGRVVSIKMTHYHFG